MLSNITVIHGQWKRISDPGEDGIASIRQSLGTSPPSVLIAHTNSVQPQPDDIPLAAAIDLNVNATYQLPYHEISDPLFADNVTDIYYATVASPNQSVELVVDFA